MKWNFWLAAVATVAVYFALSIPLWLQIKNRILDTGIQYSAPPGAAFFLALPYAICSGITVFAVCWFLQIYIKI